VSAIKDRLLAALHRDEGLLYDVCMALADHKFCGPWVALEDALGQPTGDMLREDHNEDAIALITAPTAPNSFGPEGLYQWKAHTLPMVELQHILANEEDDEGHTSGGAAEDLDEAQRQADEFLRSVGWILVPASRWDSPHNTIADIPDTKDSANPFQVLADMYVPSRSALI